MADKDTTNSSKREDKKNEEKTSVIEDPDWVEFKFTDTSANVRIRGSLFKCMYDAQVKKMLNYIALGLASFIPQTQILFFVIANNAQYTSNFIKLLITVLDIAFWIIEAFCVVAISTKYHELMIMETKLNITQIHREALYPLRPPLGKLWDKIFRVRGVEKMPKTTLLTVLTILIISFVTIIFLYVLAYALIQF